LKVLDRIGLASDTVEEDLASVDSLEAVVLPSIRDRRLVLHTIAGQCLNVKCYRGFAPADILSAISQPDVYFQYSNPEGTQRDLSADKARKAYEYMAIRRNRSKQDLRFFTEVVLNVRSADVISLRHLKNGIARITIYLDRLNDNPEDPDISRVEGNHRLAYARGTNMLSPLSIPISFCLTVGIPKLMEARLFRDINSNQRPMNTSHLDNIELQLHRGGSEHAKEHTRIADMLASDPKSPFLDLVYRGGRRLIGTRFVISLRTLGNLSRLFVLRSDKLGELSFEEQYAVIRSYWNSIAKVFPREWNDGSNGYLMMKSAGLSALTMLGARLFDDLSLLGRLDDLENSLTPLRRNVNWKIKGPLQGLNGLGGANIIYRKYLAPSVESLGGSTNGSLKRQIRKLMNQETLRAT
jgi:DGQHR domain-containing protein